jgi:IPT/TIG domain
MPRCTLTPVDDTSAACIDSVLHNINYARELEGLGPMDLPSDYAADSVPVQQLIIADEERGDRGLSQFSGLDPALDAAALTGAQQNKDPQQPGGYQANGGGANFALDYTPLGADFAWMYDDGPGGTNLDCTSAQPSGCWGHRDNILGGWTTTGMQTAQMGDADTGSGQYTQIFMNQVGTADSLVDPLTLSALPTPASPAVPDVVQVSPASAANTGAGTPVMIEGNYFNTSSTPQVFFGGVAATNVHVNWDGELSADAPADPAGTARDQVVVRVATTNGSSSPTGIAQVNEFTYAPTGAPTVTSVSPTWGTDIPTQSATVTIHGSNLSSGGVAPIVDFGTVASIGSMTYSANQITTTIPESVSPGAVDITVTTPAGTSGVTAADQYTYTGTTAPPAITSGNHATFSAGSSGLFSVTTTGTPGVSAVSDSAFNGCTPSTLPASVRLNDNGGTAALAGTPEPGDGGTYTVCLTATNGVTPVATQIFTLTVQAPATTPPPQPPPTVSPPAPQHGYWLVGSDGGIFTFGSAQFYGSTGSLHLQRPVVGITPTANRGGYWLVASDGGIFAFGNAGYYGSIPGSGLNPAGSGLPHSLNSPIVGMVPSHDGGGYFMVASDGGVFAFGDARFAGSCPGIGGCQGAAVAVVPDASGNGYWVVTSVGAVYTFGDAVYYGQPGQQSSDITSVAATANGRGYWILDAAGQVFAFGNAATLGGMPPGSAGGTDPASAIFATSDGGGYWVVTAEGKVSSFGDAPADGDMSGTRLNGPIVAASGS